MQRRRSLDQAKILNQFALPRHRLCAHTRAARLNIGYTDAWHELLKRLAEAPFAERLPQLKRGHPRVFRDKTPQAGIGNRIPQIAHVDVCLAITLARKGEYRVRAGLGAAVDQPREMHTQKRELRIWHGINQVAHQPFAALNQFIVLATERNDSRGRNAARRSSRGTCRQTHPWMSSRSTRHRAARAA